MYMRLHWDFFLSGAYLILITGSFLSAWLIAFRADKTTELKKTFCFALGLTSISISLISKAHTGIFFIFRNYNLDGFASRIC